MPLKGPQQGGRKNPKKNIVPNYKSSGNEQLSENDEIVGYFCVFSSSNYKTPFQDVSKGQLASR